MKTLAKKHLQDSINVNGKFYKIKTDFRWWLSFGNFIQDSEQKFYDDFDCFYLDSENIPEDKKSALSQLLELYNPKNELPRPRFNNNGEKACDFEEDADLIFSAFYEQYGIDLLEVDMHWHKFLALFRGLHNTKLNEVMGYRGFDPSDKTEQREYIIKLQKAWRLERKPAEINEEFEKEFS